MGKTLCIEDLSDTLHLSQCTDGFWLYDDTQGMNLSMHAPSAVRALVGALTYYQGRLKEVETQFKELNAKVEAFVAQVHECEGD